MKNNDYLKILNGWADECHTDFPNAFGYPANYNINLTEFYRWYLENGLGTKLINNAGDPFEAPNNLSTLSFEKEVNTSLRDTDSPPATSGVWSPCPEPTGTTTASTSA